MQSTGNADRTKIAIFSKHLLGIAIKAIRFILFSIQYIHIITQCQEKNMCHSVKLLNSPVLIPLTALC